MKSYSFSSDRQLFFYVSVGGQQRLVRFGERNAFGASVFQTMLRETAEAIRRHSLYKRGVIREQVEEEPADRPKVGDGSSGAYRANGANGSSGANGSNGASGANGSSGSTEVLEARNFTQARSMLAKKLGLGRNDIKTPDQLLEVARKSGITVVYKK